MPRAGIGPASSGPQPDVLPLYYRGEITLPNLDFYWKRISCNSKTILLMISILNEKKIRMPRAGIGPAYSGPQPDVIPLYYRGERTLPN
ncbi:unnamed protein product [Adineta steineri]|nr:unnamed protein product [Adineta steineri]